MLREFFLSPVPRRRVFAYLGALLIVVSALISALVTGILPSTPFTCGVLMVFYSLTLYTS